MTEAELIEIEHLALRAAEQAEKLRDRGEYIVNRRDGRGRRSARLLAKWIEDGDAIGPALEKIDELVEIIRLMRRAGLRPAQGTPVPQAYGKPVLVMRGEAS